MNTIQIKTLVQVHEAQHAILDTLENDLLAAAQKRLLKDAYNALRGIERNIIGLVETTLEQELAAIKNYSEALEALAKQINESAEELAGVAETIKKAAGVVEAFVNVGAAVVGTGLF